MTDEEFCQMITLLSKFADTAMDQFELWKFNNDSGEVLVSMSLSVGKDSSAYTDVTKLIEK
ncbi:hypothetical protein S40542_10840 [Pseudoalteromonas luteoviolacea]|uniref:Uncharacterized protein n=2 Tax=Pseudoalteromonas luteoviolacea TaxID=43657 RepID=A0A0F6AFU7_9GAMM|nr:hypothetical protein S40542_10840 [Pseudoalteromonas luteoviolacea]AOT18144.1 hypothetical protein S4054_10840 [Pseudoalteromonas luteoviolacea]KKE84254.1 hypothetical protein N479_10165 [Pseudoalteromonas luteoviolacea S4054]KZN76141.1 hypothetical protein N481_07250 [Pseudoalteromonas luteoviolacea S4047-1]